MKNYSRVILLVIGGLFVFTSLSMTPSNNQTPPPLSSLSVNSEQKELKLDAVRTKAMGLFLNAGLDVEFIEPEVNGTLSFISGNLGKASQYRAKFTQQIKTTSSYSLVKEAQPEVQAALGWLNEFSPALGIKNAQAEFIVKDYDVDESGKRHILFQQEYQGIPVWKEQLYVHINENGNIYAVNGRYEATPSQLTNLTPTITADQAFEYAKAYLQSIDKWQPISDSLKQLLEIPEPSIEKVIWFDEEGEPYLAWFLSIYAALFEPYLIFIDAQNGQLLFAVNNRMDGYFVDDSGKDCQGNTQSFRAYKYWTPDSSVTAYFLYSDKNNGQAQEYPTLTLRNGIRISSWEKQFWFASDPNSPGYDPNCWSKVLDYLRFPNNAWQDCQCVSAMVNLTKTYDYYRSTHKRNGIDDNYLNIRAYLNVTDLNKYYQIVWWNNACWDPVNKKLFFGIEKDTGIPKTASLDVVAHEFTHGVVAHTRANFNYWGQSGALHEFYADYFACMVDRDDWLFGEDLYPNHKPHIAARDLKDPRNMQLPECPIYKKPGQPAHMDEYKTLPIDQEHDIGGVHVYSGIPGKAGYLVADQIGRTKAEKIYYYALCNYLVPKSNFVDLRNCIIAAANELYGATEVNAVKYAFDQVGIYSTPTVITLSNNTPISNISEAKGSQKFYKIIIPDGQSSLVITTSGGTGDVDLYGRRRVPPQIRKCEHGDTLIYIYDECSKNNNNNESITRNNPWAGDRYIMLYGYTDYSGVTLKATYTSNTGGTLSISDNTIPSTIPAGGGNYSFKVNITGSTSGSWSITAPGWATVSPSSGTSNSTIGVSVSNNPSSSSRSGTIAVTKSGASGSPATISLNQRGTDVISLENDKPVSNISGAQDSEKFYKINVPAGQVRLEIATSGGTGDVDVYVKYGQKPTKNSYDYKSDKESNNENVTKDNPASGDWYILLFGYKEYSGTTLKATYTNVSSGTLSISDNTIPSMVPASGGTYSFKVNVSSSAGGAWSITAPAWVTINPTSGSASQTVNVNVLNNSSVSSRSGQLTVTKTGTSGSPRNVAVQQTGNDANLITNNSPITGISGLKNDSIYYKINIPAGQSWLEITTSGGTGDVDIYAKYSARPTKNMCDDKGENWGNKEALLFTSPREGFWYIMLKGYSNYTGVTLKASYGGGNDCRLFVTQYPDTVKATGGIYSFKVNLTGSYSGSWSITTSSSWLIVNPSSGSSSSQNISLTVNGNVNDLIRTGTITVTKSGAIGSPKTITITQKGNDVITLTNGVAKTNISGNKESIKYYMIKVPVGQTSLLITTSGGSGDVDLYVKRGQKPTHNNNDYESEANGNNETITISYPASGDWYILLYGYSDYKDANLKATYSKTMLNFNNIVASNIDFSQIVLQGDSCIVPHNIISGLVYKLKNDRSLELDWDAVEDENNFMGYNVYLKTSDRWNQIAGGLKENHYYEKDTDWNIPWIYGISRMYSSGESAIEAVSIPARKKEVSSIPDNPITEICYKLKNTTLELFWHLNIAENEFEGYKIYCEKNGDWIPLVSGLKDNYFFEKDIRRDVALRYGISLIMTNGETHIKEIAIPPISSPEVIHAEVSDGMIRFSWRGEPSLSDTDFEGYNIYKKQAGEWQLLVCGFQNTQFHEKIISMDRTLIYGVSKVFSGIESEIASVTNLESELNDVAMPVPQSNTLEQNYPNPFNAETVIRYAIPQSGNVRLKLYDVVGREIIILVSEDQPAGYYEVKFDAHQLSSGIYFYRLESNNFVQVRKMMLLQ